jgi:hypothetical protein
MRIGVLQVLTFGLIFPGPERIQWIDLFGEQGFAFAIHGGNMSFKYKIQNEICIDINLLWV